MSDHADTIRRVTPEEFFALKAWRAEVHNAFARAALLNLGETE